MNCKHEFAPNFCGLCGEAKPHITMEFEGLGRWDAKVTDKGIDGISIAYWERTDPVTSFRRLAVDTDLEMIQFLHGLAEAE